MAIRRRDLFKFGLAAGAVGFFSTRSNAQPDGDLKQFLCLPDGLPPDLLAHPSPRSTPFVAEMNIPPIKQPAQKPLHPPPVPGAHQRYKEFLPKKFYEIHEQEFLWQYHPEPPYDKGSWSWGFDGITPGPTYQVHYGEPILVRRYNNLPPTGKSKVTFAVPYTTSHLHNAHTASESDGYPMDFIRSGYYWDHHYCCFPSDHDPREKLTTLWYHDHMMDSTAANVYAGLAGFFLFFDEQDSGNENDPNPRAFRLPSGKYDVPMLLHDILFDQDGQVVFNKLNTDGILGDKYTVNRRIQPYFKVERRKYRFRILNGGPSRFLQIFLSSGQDRKTLHPFTIITGDGNFLPEPVCATSIYLSVAQRVDVILDFSQFKADDQLYLQNRLEQTNGRGPSGRILVPGDDIMRFDVIEATGEDKSCVPQKLRDLPTIDMNQIKRRRVWQFDYRGGVWTINGKGAGDLSTVSAAIEEGSAEMWTIRNEGKNWSHPIHSHFTEFLLYKVNGTVVGPKQIQTSDVEDPLRRSRFVNLPPAPATAANGNCGFKCTGNPIDRFMGGTRRDITTLLPNDEIEIFMRWYDFHGKYVMHCHNVVHEDHSMMIRWDIIPGKSKKKQPVSPAKSKTKPQG
ncbi:MAG: copper oxidase [Candidatus Angelobacter sp. Gp1-AA117]|nr:MAG: copper oxidase [Candidatus Angelobacter sp. Gp1-AA117]